MTIASSILVEKNRSNNRASGREGIEFSQGKWNPVPRAERNATVKSRPSEKPAKKKTKNTTAAKSAKKPVKKSVRTAAKKTTVAKKGKTAAKKTTPAKAAAEQLPPEPAEVKTASPPPPPPPPEPVTPPVAPPQTSDQEPGEDSSLAAASPVFVKRDLTGPDGSIRPGWEMWIGDHCFGRADSKDLLLASFERLQSPPSSFHWREVRNRMPIRGRTKRAPVSQDTEPVADHDEELLDDLDDVEETQDVS